MVRKKRRLNLDIGYADGEPRRGTTIGIDLPFSSHSEYWQPPTLEEIQSEPLDMVGGTGYSLPFKTGSLDRTTSHFADAIMAFPDEGYGTFQSRKKYPVPEDFDPEEHWQALIESLRVLRPGGTTRHVWDNALSSTEPRKDPYYLALMQLLKNHDMENIRIKLEDEGHYDEFSDDGKPLSQYGVILTARKKR